MKIPLDIVLQEKMVENYAQLHYGAFHVGQYELSIHLLSNALKNWRQFALAVLPIDFNDFFPSWHLTDVFNPRLEKCKSDSYNKRHENFSHQCNVAQ